jgi:Fe2+ or Zn2+ uptake regulation protein
MQKDLLLKAIPSIGLYTPAESAILKKMIEISINNVAVIMAKDLKKQLSFSHTAVYSSLKTLQLKGVITKLQSQPNSYELNQEKLEYALNLYQNVHN